MRQRVTGAIALSCQPSLLIADEPTTSLDVTIQAQYLRLLKGLQEQTGTALIFVTHDFGIVAKMCNRVGVMYAGKIVENAETRELFNNPLHPYTIALMGCLPKIEAETRRLTNIEGQPPALDNLPPGCSFVPRCPKVSERCQEDYPPETMVGRGHFVSCWNI
jgi:oligopeptide/dipeptide ABC transporter ATP-binding protein